MPSLQEPTKPKKRSLIVVAEGDDELLVEYEVSTELTCLVGPLKVQHYLAFEVQFGESLDKFFNSVIGAMAGKGGDESEGTAAALEGELLTRFMKLTCFILAARTPVRANKPVTWELVAEHLDVNALMQDLGDGMTAFDSILTDCGLFQKPPEAPEDEADPLPASEQPGDPVADAEPETQTGGKSSPPSPGGTVSGEAAS